MRENSRRKYHLIRENREEVIVRENKNFTEPIKDTNPQTQETQLNPSRIKKIMKRLHSYLTISQRNYKYKRKLENIKSSQREKTKDDQTER